MIDTHAHLYLKQFRKDLDQVMARCSEQGVERIFLPNIDHTSIDDMLEVELNYGHAIRVMMGLHPCSVKKDFEKELYIVEEWLDKRPFTAVGEIGIDLYWDRSTYTYQAEAFKIQVGWARERELPIVIHCRDSLEETLDLLEPLAHNALTGVFHCFTGGKEQAHRIMALGFKMGIGGVVTFKNAGLEDTLKEVPLEHLVLETDSPYLAPVPFRGKRNEPSYLVHVAEKLSKIYHLTQSKISEQTTKNALALFPLYP